MLFSYIVISPLQIRSRLPIFTAPFTHGVCFARRKCRRLPRAWLYSKCTSLPRTVGPLSRHVFWVGLKSAKWLESTATLRRLSLTSPTMFLHALLWLVPADFIRHSSETALLSVATLQHKLLLESMLRAPFHYFLALCRLLLAALI